MHPPLSAGWRWGAVACFAATFLLMFGGFLGIIERVPMAVARAFHGGGQLHDCGLALPRACLRAPGPGLPHRAGWTGEMGGYDQCRASRPDTDGDIIDISVRLLDHQPYHLEEAERAGIDFQFSGHTHDGQVWPISWLTRTMYEKSFGYTRRGSTEYYVSSGMGIWGPKFRIGTRSEYVVATLSGKCP